MHVLIAVLIVALGYVLAGLAPRRLDSRQRDPPRLRGLLEKPGSTRRRMHTGLSTEADGKTGAGADRAVAFLQSHDITARRETVLLAGADATATATLQAARQLDARLLVLGTERQPTLRRLLKGSLVDALLTRSHVPLFWYS